MIAPELGTISWEGFSGVSEGSLVMVDLTPGSLGFWVSGKNFFFCFCDFWSSWYNKPSDSILARAPGSLF